MTKEVDFLSLGKSENNTKTNTNTSKKEGLSLFDSLLVDNKKVENSSSEVNIEKSTENKNTQTQTSSNEEDSQNKNNVTEEKTSKTSTSSDVEQKVQTVKEKSVDTKENTQKQQVPNNQESETSNTKTNENQNKSEVKQQSSATSLLDRMVLEAKKNIKTVNSENVTNSEKEGSSTSLETKTADSTSLKEGSLTTEQKVETDTSKNSKQDIKSEVKPEQKIEENIDTKAQSKESVKVETSEKTNLTELKENSKEVDISKQETKNIDTEQKVENSNKNINSVGDIKTETKNVDKELGSDVKVVNKEQKSTESNIVNKEYLSNLDAENSEDVKTKVENIQTQKVDTVNSQNQTKDKNVEVVDSSKKIEQKVDEKSLEIETKPLVSQKENSNISDIDSNVEKESKEIVNSKEHVQTTMSFDDTEEESNNSLQKEPKTELKIDNSNQNLETKVSSTDSTNNTQINQKEEVKNTNIVQETNKIDVKNETASLDEIDTVKKEDIQTKDIKNNSGEVEKPTKTVAENIVQNTKNEPTIQESTVSKTDTTKVTVKEQNQDFSKLDSKAFVQDEQRVNVDKEALKDTPETKTQTEVKEEPKTGKSLMDRLLDNAKDQTISVKNANLNNQTLEAQTTAQKSNDVATNIFLSTQKNSIYAQLVANKSEGVKTVKNATSVEDVKQGAKVLDLGLQDTSVEVEKAVKDTVVQTTRTLDSKISVLDKIAFEKNIKTEELINNTLQAATSTSASTASSSLDETVVNLNVNSSLALSIQNRIIGAQQQMTSMMSDVARNMYENYKPPVTAFRLNLFPAQLGHIAILMKNDRENSISISMNMSQASTLDAFVENQGTLRDALNRSFENQQTSFSLDFNMEEGSDSSAFENQDDDTNQNNQTNSSDEIMESIIQNQDATEDTNYM